jgi:hypothetical protein
MISSSLFSLPLSPAPGEAILRQNREVVRNDTNQCNAAVSKILRILVLPIFGAPISDINTGGTRAPVLQVLGMKSRLPRQRYRFSYPSLLKPQLTIILFGIPLAG